jgi:mannose-6-phosphate isomerase class I
MSYDPFPVFPLADALIHDGYDSLANEISGFRRVFIDGYQGVYFDRIRDGLDQSLKTSGKTVSWVDIRQCMKPSDEIDRLLEPFLGGNDPLFGTRCTLDLIELFDAEKLNSAGTETGADITLIYGPGASLAGGEGCIVYLDLPKDVMQYRARAGKITNLGAKNPQKSKTMYKRFYFADWVLLNKHKDSLSDRVGIVADASGEEGIAWMNGNDLRQALRRMSENVFRVRPWFEPGAWGGTWIMDHVPGLRKDVPNYAWSFEMIVPENGLILESSGKKLEVSFDWLMFREAERVLGRCHGRFGKEFPIRFDFLDTFDGGNLSVQVHPQEYFIREKFGEKFTQQEAYYILDTKENALVNLGFQENISPELFKKNLEKSKSENIPVDIPFFVQEHPAQKHDFFLIPEGTIHGSGRNNLVLEISTTPYIFTFKMYDWLRLDLDGNPRDLNLGRAFDNLDFSRKGEVVARDFISRPVLLDEGEGWKKFHLPTHPLHYYDVWRYHVLTSAVIETDNRCHVLNLVEGGPVLVETDNGCSLRVSYAETFCVPAGAGSYRLSNLGEGEIMAVVAFIK